MCNSIWVFFYHLLWNHRWHIVFIASVICCSSAQGNASIFTMSDEEKEQLKQARLDYYHSISSSATYNMRAITDTEPLTNQTFVEWQNFWEQFLYDAFYYNDSYMMYSAMALDNIYNMFTYPFYLDGTFPNLSLLNQQSILQTNSLIQVQAYVYQTNAISKLDKIISQIDNITGDNGAGNPNINVNFQPIQQVLTDINDNVDISLQRLSEIEQHAYHISENTDVLKMINDEIAYQTRTLNQNLADGFDEANQTLNHIDSDLHGIIDNGVKADVDFGDMSGILDEALARNNEQLVNEIERIAEETTKPAKLGDEYMNEAYNQEQSADYVINTLIGAKDQLQNELAQIQYTNINARVYDYDEYNNYYTLESSFNNPTSNDQYIREKVQEYIDQVTYTTENVKGQITSRLDELKSSTLLTTDYDPEWLVVKKGALSQKWDFPKNDWVVDFSEIKLESNITKTVYDWIYYVLAIVVIYKQFSKVV